jgi:hypothetical protein
MENAEPRRRGKVVCGTAVLTSASVSSGEEAAEKATGGAAEEGTEDNGTAGGKVGPEVRSVAAAELMAARVGGG